MFSKSIFEVTVLIVLIDISYQLFKLIFTRLTSSVKLVRHSSLFIFTLYFAVDIWFYILFKQDNTPLQFERLSLICRYYIFLIVLFCVYFILDLLQIKKSKESGYFKPIVFGVVLGYLIPFGIGTYLLINILEWNALRHIYLSLFAIFLCVCELKFIYKQNLIEVLELLATIQEDFIKTNFNDLDQKCLKWDI